MESRLYIKYAYTRNVYVCTLKQRTRETVSVVARLSLKLHRY